MPPRSNQFSVVLGYVRLVAIVAIAVGGSTARADDEITQQLRRANELYESGDLGGAAGELDGARRLILERRGKALAAVLPEPFPGWVADSPRVDFVGDAGCGRMVTVARDYRTKDASVTVSIVRDSPSLASVSALLSKPAVESSDGSELVTIDGRRALLKFPPTSKDGTLSVVVNDTLVMVEGNGLQKRSLIEFANAVDFAGIERY